MSQSHKQMKEELSAMYYDCSTEDLVKAGLVEPHSDAYSQVMDMFDEAVDNAMESKEGIHQEKQIGGNHYAKHSIQPWNIIDEYNLDYYLGNVIKYVLRDKNNQVEDLHKAIHYLEKKIQLLESK